MIHDASSNKQNLKDLVDKFYLKIPEHPGQFFWNQSKTGLGEIDLSDE